MLDKKTQEIKLKKIKMRASVIANVIHYLIYLKDQLSIEMWTKEDLHPSLKDLQREIEKLEPMFFDEWSVKKVLEKWNAKLEEMQVLDKLETSQAKEMERELSETEKQFRIILESLPKIEGNISVSLVANITSDLITLVDLLEMNIDTVNDVLSYLTNLMEEVDKLGDEFNEWSGKLKQWYDDFTSHGFGYSRYYYLDTTIQKQRFNRILI